MPRILIAECKQEVSTFNPVASRYTDFAVRLGEEVIKHHRTVKDEIAGALAVFDARPDIELVPTYSARSITSGGVLDATEFARLYHPPRPDDRPIGTQMVVDLEHDPSFAARPDHLVRLDE